MSTDVDAPCAHLGSLTLAPMPTAGCQQCLEVGDTWVHLRYCVACGNIGCCDSSPNKHASAHWLATRHPVIRSREPGEQWAYCYADDTIVRTY